MNDRVKKIYTKKELGDVLSRDCAIFGAGHGCQYVLFGSSEHQNNIRVIFVSNRENNPNNVRGVPVYEWSKSGSNRPSRIIIAMKESNQKDVLTSVDFGENIEIYLLGDQLFYALGYEYETKQCVDLTSYKNEINQHYNNMLHIISHPCMDYMVLNILDHCNLRCKGCDHFACIAEPYLVSKNTIHKDLERMAEIMGSDYITKIGVMGGEPLLHPDLLDILKDVREHFPYAIIRLTTNGLLLGQQNELFWKTLRDNNVSIVNTKYPLQIDHEGFKKRADKEGVKFMHFEGTDNGKKLFKKKINLEGTSNPVKSFLECHISNYGNFLMEGKLYGCPFSCQSYRIFNKKFCQSLRLTDDDYLDIYKIKDKQEIFDFAARPKYYCRYCEGLSETFEWERSKQDIHEWV